MLYTVIKNNHDIIFTTLKTALSAMISNRSWQDVSSSASPQNNLDGVAVFRTLATVFLQCVYCTCYQAFRRPYAFFQILQSIQGRYPE